MVFNAQAVLTYIRQHGPAVPNQLRQALGAQDNFIVGAVLSELVAARELAMTDMSYGTSRFYYDPKAPESLEPAGKYLGDKDQRAFALLKDERVAKNDVLTPLNRVAMTQIKDFAKPLQLDTPEGPQLFWRYFLVSEDEAMDLIEEKFFHIYKPKPTSVPATTPVFESPAAAKPTLQTEETTTEVAEPARAPAKKKRSSKKKPSVQTIPSVESQSRLPPVSVAQAHPFATAIHTFFKNKEIALVQNIASTKSEFSGIVRIPSAVGAVEYFCKAKGKKTTTDGDLASAVLESQQYKLPLLFLSAGKLTKKATDLLPGLKGAVVAMLGEEEYDEE